MRPPMVDVYTVLKEVPEDGQDWLMFKSKSLSVDPSLLSLSRLAHVRDREMLPEWLNDDLEARSHVALVYPVQLRPTFIMGRMHNLLGFVAKGLRKAGMKIGSAIEERWIAFRRDNGDFILAQSALLDDDSIMLDRHEVNVSGHDPHHIMVRFSALDFEIYQAFPQNCRLNCHFCSVRREVCTCDAGMSQRLARRRSTDTTPLGIYRQFNACIEEPFIHEMIRPPNSKFSFGPTPSPVFAPRLVTVSHIDMREDLKWMVTDHLASLARKRARDVSVMLLDSSMSSDELSIGLIEAPPTPAPPTSASPPRRSRAGKGRTQCDQCGQTFSRRYDLGRHIVSVHEGVKKFSCNQCDRSFTLRSNLLTHVSDVHEKRRNVTCEVCGGNFSTAHKMRLHVRRVHLKEQPHVCSVCGYSCFQRNDLRRHMERAHETNPEIGSEVTMSPISTV